MRNNRYVIFTIVVFAAVCAFMSAAVWVQRKEPTRSMEFAVTKAGEKFPLSFLAEGVPPETKRVIAEDLQLILGRLGEVNFEEIAHDDRSSCLERYQVAVTHRLSLGDQKQWLAKVLRTHFGVAIKVDNTYHLLVAKEVVDAYQEALGFKQRRPVVFSQFDEFLEQLQDPEKRRDIARDPQKARQIFYFHKMDPWREDEYYTRNLLPSHSATICRPSLLDFTTLDAILRDNTESYIPAVLTLIQTREDDKEYVAKWPPFVYVDGHWRILVVSFP